MSEGRKTMTEESGSPAADQIDHAAVLRAAADYFGSCYDGLDTELMAAASEIDRLRDENRRLRYALSKHRDGAHESKKFPSEIQLGDTIVTKTGAEFRVAFIEQTGEELCFWDASRVNGVKTQGRVPLTVRMEE